MSLSSCGGAIATTTVTLPIGPRQAARQLVGTQESRTRVTVRAAIDNEWPVYLCTRANARPGEGFALYAGEGFQLDDRGARAELWAVGPAGVVALGEGGSLTVSVLTEAGS